MGTVVLMRKLLIAAAAAVVLGSAPAAQAAGGGVHNKAFSTVAVGAMISSSGDRFENVYRIKRSPDGPGAGFQDGVLLGTTYPVGGHDVVKTFYANGMQRTVNTFTLGAPHTDGIGAVVGKGKCAGGTGVHQKETCTYSITGTYDLATGVTMLRYAGTFSRPAVSSGGG
jgi:hypothetical protein